MNNTTQTVCQAIQVRQADRMDRGETAMTEIHLPPETYDKLMAECMGQRNAAPEFMGVKLVRIGN